jgi:hypothetical protein
VSRGGERCRSLSCSPFITVSPSQPAATGQIISEGQHAPSGQPPPALSRSMWSLAAEVIGSFAATANNGLIDRGI